MNFADSLTSPQAVIEIIGRAGQVLYRHAWDGRPLSIGRAYDNDLIVADPYVCPHHLQLGFEEGQAQLVDLESVNGSYLDNGKARLGRCTLQDGATIHFGHSVLRYHAGNSPVAPALRDAARSRSTAWLTHRWVFPLALLLALASMLTDEWWDESTSDGLLALAQGLVYPFLLLLVWAGCWSLLNRVTAQRANFLVHLSITLLGIVADFLVVEALRVVSFGFAATEQLWWLTWLAHAAVLSGVILGHLRFALHGAVHRQAWSAGLATVLLFAAPLTGDILDRTSFRTLPPLYPVPFPPQFQWVEGKSANEFLSAAEPARAAVDQAARSDQ